MLNPSLFPIHLLWTGGFSTVFSVAFPRPSPPFLKIDPSFVGNLQHLQKALSESGVLPSSKIGHYRLHFSDHSFDGQSWELAAATAVLSAWYRSLLPEKMDWKPGEAVAASGRVSASGMILPVQGWAEKLGPWLRQNPGGTVLCPAGQQGEVWERGGVPEPLLDLYDLRDFVIRRHGLQFDEKVYLPSSTSLLPGWPRPAPTFWPRWEKVHARGSTTGFVGIEHFLEGEWEGYRPEDWKPGPQLARLETPLSYSPLLQNLRLKPGFDLPDLLEAAQRSPLPTPMLPIYVNDGKGGVNAVIRTLRGEPVRAPLLQVWGGPEDGRFLQLNPGETLGRAFSENRPTVELYRNTGVLDRQMSGLHLSWDGQEFRALLKSVRILRAGGELQLQPTQSERPCQEDLWILGQTRLLCKDALNPP